MQAVLFDLDQTLLDRTRSLQDFLVWQCSGQLRPYLVSPDDFINRFIEIDANGSVWKDEVYATLKREFELHDWSVEELLSVYVNCFCAFSVPREGSLEAVRELASRYKLGLVSNGISPFQERNFRGLGFASFFDSVVVSAAVNLRKPDSRIFRLACSELSCAPSDSVYVGDNPVADIEGARAAGLHAIFVPTAHHATCSAASATCSDFHELPRIVREIPGGN